MIPPIFFELGMKYGNKVLVGLLATSLLAGGYLFWEHKQEKEGRLEERAKWEERDRNTAAQSAKILDEANRENVRLRELDQQRNYEVLKSYVEYYEKSNRDLTANLNKRLLVRTAKASCDSSAMPKQTNISKGAAQRNEGARWTELEREDSETVFRAAADADRLAYLCRQAVYFIEQNGTVK